MKKEDLKKQEEKESEEESEEEEDMEKGKKGTKKEAKKSDDLSEDDLQKSLDKLETLAGDGNQTTRKQTLLEKAQKEELSKAEQAELFTLLGGESTEPKTENLSNKVTKSLEGNDTLQKALDVSDYLQEQHNELVKSLGVLGEHIEASDNRQHEFNLVLAKAVADIGNTVVGMGERLGGIETQPARGPKSKGVQQSLEKSFAGQPNNGATEGLSKSMILDTMESMMEDSMSKGRNGNLEDGTDLVTAISKYEQFNAITPTLLAEVQAHNKKGATTH